jgi:hypothetical protein
MAVSTTTPTTAPATIPPMTPEDKPLDGGCEEEVALAVGDVAIVNVGTEDKVNEEVEGVSASVGIVILHNQTQFQK